LFLRPLDHSVPLASLRVKDLTGAGDLEALLGAGLGFQLGHFGLQRTVYPVVPGEIQGSAPSVLKSKTNRRGSP
jgi:hypothetical protein